VVAAARVARETKEHLHQVRKATDLVERARLVNPIGSSG
jgi:hypothetical protein